MDMLVEHVDRHGVPACIGTFLTVLACSVRASEQRRDIVSRAGILKLVEAALESDGGSRHATKLKALFATSSVPLSNAYALCMRQID